jgi:peptide/nickel transport system permease protein
MSEVKNTEQSQAYWSYVNRQFRKNKRALFSMYVVAFLAFIAVFADFLANEKPIWCSYKGQSYFPILKSYGVDLGLTQWPKDLQNIDWINTTFDKTLRAPVPYSPTTQDIFNSGFISPFGKQSVTSTRWRHWLGTEAIGRDILAALIHGTRIALLVGIVSMSIATVIGILLGALAGYFGDNRIQLSRANLLTGIIFSILGFFYAFSARSYALGDALSRSVAAFLVQLLFSLLLLFAVLAIGYGIGYLLKFIPFLRKKIFLPIDIIVLRLIEILVSIPRLFLIIAIVAVAKPGIFLVMAVIGLTSWTDIARFIRAELLRVRSLEYIEAAEALGYSRWRILLKHAGADHSGVWYRGGYPGGVLPVLHWRRNSARNIDLGKIVKPGERWQIRVVGSYFSGFCDLFNGNFV